MRHCTEGSDAPQGSGETGTTIRRALAMEMIHQDARALLEAGERRDGESKKDYDLRESLRGKGSQEKEDAIFEYLQFRHSASDLPERAARLAIRMAVRGWDFPVARTLGDVIDNPPPDVSWPIPGLIREGLNLLSAPPKAGKSTMARSLALSVASDNGMALGRIDDVETGDVLLVSLEDGEATILQDMEAMTEPGGGIPTEARPRITIWTGRDVPNMDRGLAEMLEWWIVCHPGARLIILDCYGKLASASRDMEDPYQKVYRELDPLKDLGDHYRLGVLLLHHEGKTGKDRDAVYRPLGTSAFAGAPDCLLSLERERHQTVLVVQGRGIVPIEHSMSFDPVSRSLTLEGEAIGVRSKTRKEAILAVLRDQGALSPAEIHAALPEHLDGDTPAQGTVRKALGEMAHAQPPSVVAEGGGKKRVYRLPDPPDSESGAEEASEPKPAPTERVKVLREGEIQFTGEPAEGSIPFKVDSKNGKG